MDTSRKNLARYIRLLYQLLYARTFSSHMNGYVTEKFLDLFVSFVISVCYIRLLYQLLYH
jgi:hypothetical protein